MNILPRTTTEVERSLSTFHGHPVNIYGAANTYSSPFTRAVEVYALHPDGSRGYEHTIDGVTWIPRERSIFDCSIGH